VAGVLAAAIVGAFTLYSQAVGRGVELAAENALRGGDLVMLRKWEGYCWPRCTVAAQIAGGGARAALASRLQGSDRIDRLTEAEGLLAQATRLEPLNGDAWMQMAYAYGLHDLGPSPRMLAALRASYRAQPFSERGGLWRLHTVGGYWPLLPADVRAFAVEEGRWRWSIHPDERTAILAALPNPQARLTLAAKIAAAPPRPY
jgi:hypothetical protein